MAHKLNFKDNKVSLFSVKEICWHGLGQVLDAPPTVEEGIIYAGLDYQVKKAQLYAALVKGEKGVKVEDRYVTFRDDTKDIFEVVSKQYNIVQNLEAFEFFNPLIKQFDLTLETAGALGKGEEIFITAKTNSPIKINGNDVIDNYLLLTNRHDGKGAVQIMFTPIRVVCNNTLCAALRNNVNRMAIKHYGSSEEQLKVAQKILINIFEDSISLNQYYELLSRTTITDVQLSNYVVNSLGLLVAEDLVTEETKSKFDRDTILLKEVLEYAEIGPGQASIKGSAWGAYNSVTGYFSNMKTYKNAESKLNSLVKGGEDFKVNKRALELTEMLLN